MFATGARPGLSLKCSQHRNDPSRFQCGHVVAMTILGVLINPAREGGKVLAAYEFIGSWVNQSFGECPDIQPL